MTRPTGNTVTIVPHDAERALSAGQQAFNALIAQIGKKRERLAEWEAATGAYHQKYVGSLLPLLDELAAQRAGLVRRLDQASFDPLLTRAERRTIAELIVEMAGELLAAGDDPALKDIYNRHSGSDYDRDEAEGARELKSLLEESLGVDLGEDAEYGTPEELYERVEAQMRAQRARFDAEQRDRAAARAARRKTARPTARDARMQDDAQQAGRSIREVYRKLVSALHPDREPDPAERARKTALMQRVNEAYGKNNLLQLLELQLELEHIDQRALNDIGEERLQHYNRILRDQLGELDDEIRRVEREFRTQFGFDSPGRMAPHTIVRDLGRDIRDVQHAIGELKHDLRLFGDTNRVKDWLRQTRRQRRSDRDDGPSY